MGPDLGACTDQICAPDLGELAAESGGEDDGCRRPLLAGNGPRALSGRRPFLLGDHCKILSPAGDRTHLESSSQVEAPQGVRIETGIQGPHAYRGEAMKLLFSPPSSDDLIRLLKAWRFWLAGAILGALLGGAVYLILPPPFRATATVNVDFHLEQASPQNAPSVQFYYLERATRKLELIA